MVGSPSDSLATCNGAMNYFDSDMFQVCKTCCAFWQTFTFTFFTWHLHVHLRVHWPCQARYFI